jgi:hypothetical protein
MRLTSPPAPFPKREGGAPLPPFSKSVLPSHLHYNPQPLSLPLSVYGEG